MILVVLPLFVVMLLAAEPPVRAARPSELEHDVPAAATAPILRRHVVLVFVDRLDMAAARAIQYARTLTPDELRAVHFALDDERGRGAGRRVGAHRAAARAARARRLPRPAAHPGRGRARGPRAGRRRDRGQSSCCPTASTAGSGTASCTTGPPTRSSSEVSRLPHANVTTVPFHLDVRGERPGAAVGHRHAARAAATARAAGAPPSPTAAADGRRRDGTSACPARVPIADAQLAPAGARRRPASARVRVAPQHDAPTLELVLVDGTGVDLGGLPRPPRHRRRRRRHDAWPSRARSASTRPASPS